MCCPSCYTELFNPEYSGANQTLSLAMQFDRLSQFAGLFWASSAAWFFGLAAALINNLIIGLP
jgi:hypothetical protein